MPITRDRVREELLDQVLGATTLLEIDAARQALRSWLIVHPDEIGLADGFEQLANMQEIAESQEEDLTLSIDAARK